MAYSRVVAIGDGSTTQFAVNFALDYLLETDVTCRVGNEMDGSGQPSYRPITFLATNLIQVGGAPAGNGVAVTFERTVDKDLLRVDYSNGDELAEDNLMIAQKQAMMAVHEVLDGRTALGNAVADDAEAATQARIQAEAARDEAAAAKSEAQNVYNAFRGTFYGPLSADPTLDPNGDPVSEGDFYFNTTSKALKLFDGTAWVEYAAAAAPAPPTYTAPGTGTLTRTLTDRLSDMVFVHDYGTNLAAINAAKADAIALGRSLAFTDGIYTINDTLELGHQGLKVLALGGNVLIKHTGVGRAVSFDGSDVTGHFYNQEFGGPNVFNIEGNTNTTDLLYTHLVHNSRFRAHLRNGQAGWRNDFTVCNKYEIVVSGNEQVFTTIPLWGAIVTELYAAECRLLLEQCGGGGNFGLQMLAGNACNTFWGTSENHVSGGVYISAGSVRNTFIGYDAEVNRAGYDWFIEGSGNTFIGIVGSATTLGSLITGHRNTFINSLLENVNVAAGATDNKFDGCELTTAFNDSGTGTVRTRCTGVVSNTDRYVVSVPASGSAVFMGNLSGLVLIREMDTTGEIATFVLGPFGVGGLTFQSSTHWSFGTTPTQRWSVGNDGTNYRIYNAEAGIRRFGITRFTVPLA